MSIELDGKVAIITGAARGIGRAVAEAMCSAGASVLAVDILDNVEDVPKAFHKCWKGLAADVSDSGSVQAMVEGCVSQFGPPDILVNVAAISTPCPAKDLTLEQWERTLRVNLTSVFLCSQAVLPYMIEQKRGSIISFSSVLAEIGGKGSSHYAAAKAGVEAFSKSLAREVAPFGVRVNVVAPGMVDTKMLDLMNTRQKAALAKRIPLQRIGMPKDLVEPVLLLASDRASYITGQVIRVDGGMNMS